MVNLLPGSIRKPIFKCNVVVLFCAMLPLQVAGSEFSESVRSSFDQWIELLKQEQQLRLQLGYGIRQPGEYKELAARTGAARRAFANDVAAHWPFKIHDKTKRMLNEAMQAMVEARKYAQAYREGLILETNGSVGAETLHQTGDLRAPGPCNRADGLAASAPQ